MKTKLIISTLMKQKTLREGYSHTYHLPLPPLSSILHKQKSFDRTKNINQSSSRLNGRNLSSFWSVIYNFSLDMKLTHWGITATPADAFSGDLLSLFGLNHDEFTNSCDEEHSDTLFTPMCLQTTRAFSPAEREASKLRRRDRPSSPA